MASPKGGIKSPIDLVDRTGQFKDVTRIIADHGANVVSVQHERNTGTSNVNSE